jgi:hypothetical protein
MKKLGKLGLVSAIFLLACSSSLTGNEGNFQFSYTADDRITDFNKPIAVGASLDLEVVDVGAQLPINLTEASTETSSVIDVIWFNDNTVTVTATGEGSTLLSVAGTTIDGQARTDSVNLLASVPEVHLLWHTCAPGMQEAAYLANQSVLLPFDMEMANGQPVIGYGYYPITLEGAPGITLDAASSTQRHIALDIDATIGTALLTSAIDGSTLSLRVVEPGQIDGIGAPVAFGAEETSVGDNNAFYVLPTVGQTSICQAGLAPRLTVSTPDVCDVSSSEVLDPTTNESGWFSVEGLAAGTCTFTVTYPDGNSGAGVTEAFSYAVIP